MTITPEMLVQREVFYCVSSLVSTLAQSQGVDVLYREPVGCNVANLIDQAQELAFPIDDWEEAAIQEGWQEMRFGDETVIRRDDIEVDSWQDACESENIEPYQREVFEHWIVSDWLADKLAEKGEKVDKDFAGMTIWARTTTGQAIALDSVIEAICAELNV